MKGTAHKPASNLGSIPKPKGGTGRTVEGSSVGKAVSPQAAKNDPMAFANGRGFGEGANKKNNPTPRCYAQGPQPFKK